MGCDRDAIGAAGEGNPADTPFRNIPQMPLFKVWPVDQQQQQHLGARCRLLPDLLKQKLPFRNGMWISSQVNHVQVKLWKANYRSPSPPHCSTNKRGPNGQVSLKRSKPCPSLADSASWQVKDKDVLRKDTCLKHQCSSNLFDSLTMTRQP